MRGGTCRKNSGSWVSYAQGQAALLHAVATIALLGHAAHAAHTRGHTTGGHHARRGGHAAHTAGAREHELVHAHHVGSRGRLLLGHTGGMCLREVIDLGCQLAHRLDHVRHGKVHDVVAPGKLKHLVGLDQVVACVQAGSKALFVANLQEVLEEALSDLGVRRLGSVFHSILEQLVLLAQLDRVRPAVVALVQVGSNAPELNELVLLQSLSELDVVKVLVLVDRLAQRLVVALLNQERVKRLVDRLVVVGLHLEQVGLDKRKVVCADEKVHGTGMVDARNEDRQHVVEEQRLVVQVELNGLVVELSVGDLDDHLLERVLLPGLGGVLHHGRHTLVIVLILVVQEHKLAPEMRLLGGAQHLGDVDARPVHLQMILHLLGLVL
eukprot:m.287993 g.287993  ORF g.287993 m.287993 type:complete len:381 (+) comp11879_c0_seq1:284-1426(+)